jgi:pimeloyl-ACP methyl ester carboxylesterase
VRATERKNRSGLVAGGVALGLGAAGASVWALQHRSVSRATAGDEDRAAEELTLPSDLVHHVVEADDGARISVVERGSGPTIVLLHGFMFESSIWAQQFRDLSSTRRLVAVDQRGHGRSELGRPSGDVRRSARRSAQPVTEAGRGAPAVARMASDLRRILVTLDVSEALLVGHSMGGMVALQLACDDPSFFSSRVNALALVSTMADPLVHPRGLARGTRLSAPVAARSVLLMARLGLGTVPSRDMRYWVSRMCFGAEATNAQVRFVEQMHAATSGRTIAEQLPSLAVFDLYSTLGSVSVPVLVVVGSHDHLTPPGQARRMADVLTRAELVELPRCGHMPMIERPHEFSHLLEEFSAKASHA